MPHTADDSDLDKTSLDELIFLPEAAELSGRSATNRHPFFALRRDIKMQVSYPDWYRSSGMLGVQQ
jgi:hypothetical protein